MLSFRAQCPHCNARDNVACIGFSDYLIENEISPESGSENNFVRINGKMVELARFSLAAVCRDCKKPFIATCRAPKTQYEEAIKNCCHSNRDTLIRPDVLAVYPQPAPPYGHCSLPEEVNKSFVDLQLMLREKKRPHLIIMGCRTVLENAVRELGSEGNSLAERIDDLFNKRVLTSSLHDWASIIRRHGNAAAHEMAGTEEEATELVNFTKVFLQFTFELPATIQAQRK